MKTIMSFELSNRILEMGTPCDWKPSQAFIYFILAQRYQNDSKPAYPGMDELMRVTNLKRSAIQKHLRQLKKEGWIIQSKKGFTGQRAEYLVRFFESDLHRCKPDSTCRNRVSATVTEREESSHQEVPPRSSSASTLLHPKRITNKTNKTNQRIDENRFKFVMSQVPLQVRSQITTGKNLEALLDEFMEIGVSLIEIRNHLGSQEWGNATTPGGLLTEILRRFLFAMSRRPMREKSDGSIYPPPTTREVQMQAIAGFAQSFKIPN